MKRTKMSDGWVKIEQPGAPVLGYSPDSKVKIIECDGLPFKSFNGSDELLPYEDWRRPALERAKDLSARLAIE